MSLLKSMFGGGDKSPALRSINSPKDLLPGDMLKMEFSEQTLISGQTLKVSEQLSYDLSAEESCKTVSIMEGLDQRTLVSISTVNPERPLEIAIEILPETIFKLFKRKAFVAIFEQPDNTDHRLVCKIKHSKLDDLQGMVGENYFQERTNEAYRSTKNCRQTTLPEADWSGFDYKLLVSDDRKHALRIEVFDGGRTDVYLIAYLALNKIEEYWPA